MDDVCPLAQSGLNIDPDNIPPWEHTLHHASLEEHYDEVGAVLTLAEAFYFRKSRWCSAQRRRHQRGQI